MEGTRYETVPANELVERLQTTQEQHVASPNADTARALLGTLIEARTRVSMSDEPRSRRFGADELGRDLISYSSKEQVEQERMNLDVAISSARVELQRILDDSDDATLQNITGNTDRSLPDILDRGAVIYRSVFEWDLSRKDEAFRRLQMSRAAKAAVVGAAVGGVMGFASQELRAVFDGGMQGLGEQFQQGQDRLTELAALVHGTHHAVQGKVPNLDFAHSGFRVGNNALDLPPGYHVVHEGKGYELIGPDKHAIGPIAFNSKGGLDSATQAMLEKHGFKLDTTTEAFSTVQTETTTTDMSFDQYMKAHPNRFAPIHRQFWYENGTYDHNGSTIHSEMNEQLLLWGGENGTGVDSQGNYVFDVSHMMANGSFHVEHTAQGTEFIRANAPELLKDHKLYIAISATKGTQFNVIYVPINEHGQAVFDPHDPLFKSLFSTENGHAHFNGAYAEVVQDMGKTSDGGMSVRMLATVVGSNHPNAIQETIQTAVRGMGEHVVTHLGAPAEAGLPVEIAPVIPIRSRRGMEALAGQETSLELPSTNPSPYEGGYYGYMLKREREEWRQERSPRLRQNPEADLDTGEELAWYREEQRRKRGQEYIEEIDSYVNGNEVLRNIGNETKAIVCIPVAAANESENIFNTLSLYAQQDEDSTRESVILLNLNWKSDTENDPTAMAKVQKTHDEIERARRAFPNLRIATFDKVWSLELIHQRTNDDGSVRLYGEVVKILYDTAAFAVGNATQQGRRQSAEEAVLLTNDADAQGMSRQYLKRYINALEAHPTSDVFTGLIRWGTEDFKNYPGYGLVSNMFGVFNMTTQRGNGNRNQLSTIGPNAGFRLSAFAAVGGCEDNDRLGAGADSVLGQRVIAARREEQPAASYRPYGSTYAGAMTKPLAGGGRKVTAFVPGAQIDTLGDRLLGAYRRGQWIGQAWDTFDSAGYMDRSVAAKGELQPENPRHDIDSIAERIAANVNLFVNRWYREPGHAASALALYFGTKDEKGQPLYDAKWEGTPGWDGDGTFKFTFTKEGKAWLKKRLLTDLGGKPDPYGARIRRRLYNEVQPRDKHKVLATPRFVAHTT